MQKQKINKLIIGVTGSFGSGKNTVSGIFKSLGAKIIDADAIAHSCIKPDKQAYRKIIYFFGRDILKPNQEIDRKRLGRLVFADKQLLKKLNSFIHPQIIKTIRSKINRIKKGVIILNAPLLLEAGLRNMVDKLVVVKIDRRKQLARLSKNTSLGQEEIIKRIKYQIPLSAKVRLADFIIDNGGSIRETHDQVKIIMETLIPCPPSRVRDQFFNP